MRPVFYFLFLPFPLPSSPPPKEGAFEEFKLGQGSKINSILKENKALLLERRNLLRQLTEEVNAVKRDIDCTATVIQQHRDLRGDQGILSRIKNVPRVHMRLNLVFPNVFT